MEKTIGQKRQYKVAVFDLDGCIMDDITAQFNSKFGKQDPGMCNSIFKETLFNAAQLLLRGKEFHKSLLNEYTLDENVINVMRQMQEVGTEINIVTKNKGVNEKWLSNLMNRYGININPKNIHKVNGNKGSKIKELNANIVFDDQPDIISVIHKAYNKNAKNLPLIVLIRREYNNILTTILRNVDKNIVVVNSEDLLNFLDYK
ncbi:MAG: hypothetical protein M1538_00715 [Candidatus Marsarchaeota archaeon]|jgi:hypothetical protein|nr:hypothetical protein [Candidatus Marsarchaeota archaeon]